MVIFNTAHPSSRDMRANEPDGHFSFDVVNAVFHVGPGRGRSGLRAQGGKARERHTRREDQGSQASSGVQRWIVKDEI